MKSKMALLVGAMALCLGLVGAPASWANSLTFQNVTFDLSLNGGNLDLRVTNALIANGDWTGIETLGAFQLNNYGTASGLAVTGWTAEAGGLSAGGSGGCNGTGSGTCFENAGFALNNDFTLSITKTSGAFDLNLATDTAGLFGPHLKVFFGGANQGDGHGNLLSTTVPAVPVPGTLLMFGVGFALFAGWHYYRSRQRLGPVGLAA